MEIGRANSHFKQPANYANLFTYTNKYTPTHTYTKMRTYTKHTYETQTHKYTYFSHSVEKYKF